MMFLFVVACGGNKIHAYIIEGLMPTPQTGEAQKKAGRRGGGARGIPAYLLRGHAHTYNDVYMYAYTSYIRPVDEQESRKAPHEDNNA